MRGTASRGVTRLELHAHLWSSLTFENTSLPEFLAYDSLSPLRELCISEIIEKKNVMQVRIS